jgi:predicted transcriptional regulator
MAQRSLKLADQLDADLVAKAKKVDRPVSWVIRRAIEHALYGRCTRRFEDLSPYEQGLAMQRGLTGRDHGAA